MADADQTAESRRLHILESHEVDALYGRPRFTPDEQQLYFTLTEAEQAACAELRSLASQVGFVLQLGYFKAKQLFFAFTFAEVADDVAAILSRHFPTAVTAPWEPLSKPTILKQRTLILQLLQYRLCRAPQRQQAIFHTRQLAQISSKPIYIFRELLQFFAEQRIVAPGYTVMQNLVSQAVTFEQQRLTRILQHSLTLDDTAALDKLIAETEGLYRITRLKHEPADFSRGAMREEIERATLLHPLAALAGRVIPALAISPDAVAYYASLVSYYSVFRLLQLDRWLCYLDLLCFILHRYHRCHDHVLAAFIHGVTAFTEESREQAKIQAATQRQERDDDLVKAGGVLQLFLTDPPTPAMPFLTVQAQAFALLDRARLARVAAYLTTKAPVDEQALQWEVIEGMHRRWKPALRPLLQAADLSTGRADAPLLEAVRFITRTLAAGSSLKQLDPESFPSRWLPVRQKRYLYTQEPAEGKRLIPDRYEFLAYQRVRNGLEAGDVVCQQSVQFRSFEDDLLSDAQWQANADLLTASGRVILDRPIHEQLAELESQLEARIQEVNARIADGENTHIRITRRGERTRWTLPYPRSSEPVNHPIFDDLPQVDLSRVLAFADAGCQMLEAFSHLLGRYGQPTVYPAVLRACLVAWGTNMGLGRMGDISDISTHILARASENYLRPETLKAANDRVSNAIAALPITACYDLGGQRHSSSDGQKFETAIPTFNARSSWKYFGLHKGIVADTLMVGYVPVNALIIGAHEHESHYVLDLLLNNTTSLQPAVHSTDTHGTNQVNFALLHVFGFQFAPRYRNIQEKMKTGLYGFQHPRAYAELLLRPIRKLKTELIIAEWDNLRRIFASLALKTTSQSIIVRKLNAYAGYSRDTCKNGK
ncbi:Tn3 family transposase [Chloroflexus sp.]|uniref:Tn3 family transposase n=1 Tax=Chloroflexus sp. TaxID=1904827 RepID=UPI002ACEBAE8|nr:Tn3 family transposase [Chloroflexus sp.]